MERESCCQTIRSMCSGIYLVTWKHKCVEVWIRAVGVAIWRHRNLEVKRRAEGVLQACRCRGMKLSLRGPCRSGDVEAWSSRGVDHTEG
jgi:hypothetical protein